MSAYGKSTTSFNFARQSRYNPYGKGRKKQANQFGVKKGQQGFNLKAINWTQLELAPFKKDFLSPLLKKIKKKAKSVDIDEWREENAIKVLSGYNAIIKNDKSRNYSGFAYNERANWNFDEDYDDLDENGQEPPEIPPPVFNFDDLDFPEFILNNIQQAGFEKPTPIQSQAWPMILSGCDVIGIAQTGSGKTVAFLLPAIIHMLDQPKLEDIDGPISLVVAPTRELACQIDEEIQKFTRGSHKSNNNNGKVNKIRRVCVYGGADRSLQQTKLTAGVEIITATPGRLLDFLEKEVTNLLRVTYLVIDEADRLLDMGFEPQLLSIANQIRPNRQMSMFSATWPKSVINLAKKFLTKSNNIYQVIIGSKDLNCSKTVKQYVKILRNPEKMTNLKNICNKIIESKEKENAFAKILVFVKTKKSADWLYEKLWEEGYYASSIHGDKTQNARTKAITQFKNDEINILIATDVASRGLHVDDIDIVINFDFPQTIEDYVHRIGRTGRVDKSGVSYTFMTDDDGGKKAKALIGVMKDNDQDIPDDLKRLANNNGGFGGRRGGGFRNGGFRNGRKNGRGRGRGRGRGHIRF